MRATAGLVDPDIEQQRQRGHDHGQRRQPLDRPHQIILADKLNVNPASTATLAINGDISESAPGNFSLTFSGPGQLILAGNNTYTGGTIVTNGTLVLNTDSALLDGSNLTSRTTSSRSSVPLACCRWRRRPARRAGWPQFPSRGPWPCWRPGRCWRDSPLGENVTPRAKDWQINNCRIVPLHRKRRYFRRPTATLLSRRS